MRPNRSKTLFDLSNMFAKLAAFAPGEDDDEENEDENEGDGSSGAGGDEGDKDTDASGDKSKKPIKDPVKKAASDEAARYRVAAREAKTRADAAEAKLKEIEDKDKSELDLAKAENVTLKADFEKLQKLSTDQGLRLALFESGAANILRKPGQAIKLMELSAFKPDEDDGSYDEKKLLEYVEGWLKENPHFAAADRDDDEGDDEKPNSGKPNGKPKNQASDQLLAKKFPALASR